MQRRALKQGKSTGNLVALPRYLGGPGPAAARAAAPATGPPPGASRVRSVAQAGACTLCVPHITSDLSRWKPFFSETVVLQCDARTIDERIASSSQYSYGTMHRRECYELNTNTRQVQTVILNLDKNLCWPADETDFKVGDQVGCEPKIKVLNADVVC